MDKEQEQLQFLGFISIFKESLKIILKKPKIFTQITLAFILPLSCISLANIGIYKFPTTNNTTQEVSPNQFSSENVTFWLIRIACSVFTFAFALISTSAVIYTVACVHTSNEITFKKVLSIVPKVWKRLMITSLSITLVSMIVAVSVITIFVMIISMIVISSTSSKLDDILTGVVPTLIIIILAFFFIIGLFCIGILWQLANVISVLENSCGYQALKRSMKLIKGKRLTAISIVLVTGVISIPIQLLIYQIIVSDDIISVKIFYGIIIVFSNTILSLYGLVVKTVFYFVCKSYHHENIDKSILVDHLETFLGEYVPLKNETLEIEHLRV